LSTFLFDLLNEAANPQTPLYGIVENEADGRTASHPEAIAKQALNIASRMIESGQRTLLLRLAAHDGYMDPRLHKVGRELNPDDREKPDSRILKLIQDNVARLLLNALGE
jgi:hypothetical protein